MKIKASIVSITLLTMSVISNSILADIVLVGESTAETVSTIPAKGLLPLNHKIAGKVTLIKNSQINIIETSLSGLGSVLISIYSNNEQTNRPDVALYQVVKNINNNIFGEPTVISDIGLRLSKGNYWLMLESTTVIDDIWFNENPNIVPLDTYIYNDMVSGEWRLIQRGFPLIITGHPTGNVTY